ncbi:MAG TPA: biotin--[acetyl-CoA-carboxylase] ligase [Intrasporangium sp.]|uniref:biotin--[acetyl-CoA-carboxylase] ligase n=1 Tax=Intrasporangium sp. TaxID=1925024 RepID=UPI002B471B10|nr:biotin--[acetyl-CoA-carboxylase] ligase [Intrasporangium sp.]HKX68341.1 biotin--[acetyl-CoA-carboxylase] ligase [Intrasporangium sp.]
MRESLRPDRIRAALVTSGQPWQSVEFHPSIGSTNSRAIEIVSTYAAGLAPTDSPLWRVVLTDDQTGGRGRLGRSWQVPPRASIAVSAIVPAPGPEVLAWVSLLAGLALVRAVRAVTTSAGAPVGARLKWPNDVLLPADDGRKVAGILCELTGWGQGRYAVVVGAGVNVDQRRDELPVDTATSLRLAGARVRRDDLVIAYLRELPAVLQDRSAREEYRRTCTTPGSQVRVHLPSGGLAEGRAVRVDDSGALVVEVAGREQAFSAGDVVHLRPGGDPAGMIGP